MINIYLEQENFPERDYLPVRSGKIPDLAPAKNSDHAFCKLLHLSSYPYLL
jgi:hypothetical protein